MKYFHSIFVSVILIVVPMMARALGIGATPARLDITLAPHETASREVEIYNIGDDELLYHVSADAYAHAIQLEPEDFSISGNSTKKITVTVNAAEAGITETTLSVVAKSPTEQDFQPRSGIKIPLTLTVAAPSASWPQPFWWLALFVVLIATGFGAYQWKLQSQKLNL